MVFEGPGPPIFNYFCNCFRTPSRSSFFVFFCRFVGRQGSRFGASGLHFFTPKKEAKKVTRVCAGVRECMRLYAKVGGGYPTKIKDMPIRDGFPHQFTPAVPRGTVADIYIYMYFYSIDIHISVTVLAQASLAQYVASRLCIQHCAQHVLNFQC